MTERRIRKILQLFLAVGMSLYLCMPVFAANPGTVLSYGISGKSILLYAADPGDDATIAAQVGTKEVKSVQSVKLAEDKANFETVILVDNSKSVSANQSTTNQILTNLIGARLPNEAISVGTISNQVNFLVQQSQDYSTLKKAIDSIQYQDQSAYLVSSLYNLFKYWEQHPDGAYRRLIVISDGANEEDIGITMTELTQAIQARPYPVYTFGYSNAKKSNSKQLENLFSIARASQGANMLLAKGMDPMQPVELIVSEDAIRKIVLTPDEKILDGSDKGILLTYTAGGQTFTAETTVKLPFGEEKETTAAPTTVETTEAAKETVAVTTAAVEENAGSPFGFVIVAGVVVIAIILIVVILVLVLSKKKEKEAFQPAPRDAGSFGDSFREERKPAPTPMPRDPEDGGTAMIWDEYAAATPTLVIQLLGQSNGRSFREPLSGEVTVGRKDGCTVVIEDPTVSHQHCSFTYQDGTLMLHNLSRFGTIVNGRKVMDQIPVSNGSMIKLGNISAKISLQ